MRQPVLPATSPASRLRHHTHRKVGRPTPLGLHCMERTKKQGWTLCPCRSRRLRPPSPYEIHRKETRGGSLSWFPPHPASGPAGRRHLSAADVPLLFPARREITSRERLSLATGWRVWARGSAVSRASDARPYKAATQDSRGILRTIHFDG